jgi:decaprenylphospho-beta-D-erythro-pentofuranosid-2-ulose 2-reductase
MQKILVLGATSTIAQEVERILAKDSKDLLLVARSAERLSTLRADLLVRGARSVQTFAADFHNFRQCSELMDWARGCHSDFDTVLLAYGSMRSQEECEEQTELIAEELSTNFVSAATLLATFAKHFEERRTGCLAVITSVAGDRGRRSNYIYGSAKGGLSLLCQGLRSRLHSKGVRVITIKPGPVGTAMTDRIHRTRLFAEVEVVAKDICRALEKRSPDILYTPWPWRYVMFAIRVIPEGLFKRISL